MKGTAAGQAVTTEPAGTFKSLATGEEKVTQTLLFGEAQQNTFGADLFVGPLTVLITGAIDFRLSGGRTGSVFGVS
jgi:hypothetical protein